MSIDRKEFGEFFEKKLLPIIVGDTQKTLFEKAEKAVEDNRFDDAGFFLTLLSWIDPEFERKVCHLTLNKIRDDIKEDAIVDHFLLQIGDNVIFLVFALNTASNQFYSLFKHVFGSGALFRIDYKRTKSRLIRIGTTERTNEVVLRHNSDSFNIIVDSTTKMVSIIVDEANTKYSEKDVMIEDSKGKRIEGEIEKGILKYNLEQYFVDYARELA